MEVRDAAPTDTAALRRVYRAAIEELGPEAYSPEQVAAWASGCTDADYAAVEADDTPFLVAEVDGGVVGFGSLSFDASDAYGFDPDAEVTGVYVRPDATRRGVGSALLDALERRARAADATTLGLSASLNAVPFYEAHGYERVDEREHEFSAPSGVAGTVVEMRKTTAHHGSDR